MKRTISVMHCFDNNYVIPAGVAFHSLLRHANPLNQYALYVLHSDITKQNQDKLKASVREFQNAEILFIDMKGKFSGLFEKTKSKAHYSKEIYYKFLAPSIFPDIDKIIVSDVDVIYLGDISEPYLKFEADSDTLIAGTPGLARRDSFITEYMRSYERDFSANEIARLRVGAGFYIANLKAMRQHNTEQKLIAFAKANADRLIQPEQDAINLVCHPKIEFLPPNSMVCSYSYDLYKSEGDFQEDLHFSAEEVRHALNAPIQLHFAGAEKPWNKLDCTRSEAWFHALSQTTLFPDFMLNVQGRLNEINKQKTVISFKPPFSRRKFVLSTLKT